MTSKTCCDRRGAVKTIVCFGDSNTWGYDPVHLGRYGDHVRWTGILQDQLGSDYRIIEEGQNGRTISQADPAEGGWKCGLDYLVPMLESHMPVDLLIVMLGTNDMKQRFCLSADDIAGTLQTLLERAKTFDDFRRMLPGRMKILAVSPAPVGERMEESHFFGMFGKESVKKSRELASRYAAVAEKIGCGFFDAAAVTAAGETDQLHLEQDGHAALGKALAEKVLEILG